MKTFLTLKQAAELLGISTSHLYKKTMNREIPFFKPNGGKIYFLKEDLEAWILSGRIKTIEEIEKQALGR